MVPSLALANSRELSPLIWVDPAALAMEDIAVARWLAGGLREEGSRRWVEPVVRWWLCGAKSR